MKREILLLACLLLVCTSLVAAEIDTEKRKLYSPRLTVGLEQDVLPYFLRGFIGTGWIGRNGMRVRFSYAQASQPRFFRGDGIVRDRVEAFGLSLEYFINGRFSGWWLGPGIGAWTNVVDTEGGGRYYHASTLFTFGGGYVWELTRWLYVSTWTALHSRVSGNRAVDLGGTNYKPMVVTPEVSVKIGIRLNL